MEVPKPVRVKIKLKEFEMPNDKNKTGSFPIPPKGPQPPPKKIEGSDSTFWVKGGNKPKKDSTANLFEDQIRQEKKEGA